MAEVNQEQQKQDADAFKEQLLQELGNISLHPLQASLEEVLDLKAEKQYEAADDLCWSVLAKYGITYNPPIYNEATEKIVARVPEEDRVMVSGFLYQLALTFEFKKNKPEIGNSRSEDVESRRDIFLAREVKLLLITTDLNHDFPLAAARLAGAAVNMVPPELERIKYLIALPKYNAATPDKFLNELREDALLRLIRSFDNPPFELLEEHFSGELPLKDEWVVREKLTENDPRAIEIAELTWVLSDCAKLSINIVNYYRFFEPAKKFEIEQFSEFTRQFAGTVLAVFDISRDIEGANQAIRQKQENFGKRKQNIVNALTNLGSISEGDDKETAKKWFALALHLEPKNEYAIKRLDALNSRQGVDWRRVSNLISSLEPQSKVVGSSLGWSEHFEQKAPRRLHSEILANIDREDIVQDYPALREVAVEFGRAVRVIILSDITVASAYLKNLEQTADSFWETAYEAAGNLELQARISLINLLIERKLLNESINTKNLLEKLIEIRDSFHASLKLPETDSQHAFFRMVYDLIREDIRKHP